MCFFALDHAIREGVVIQYVSSVYELAVTFATLQKIPTMKAILFSCLLCSICLASNPIQAQMEAYKIFDQNGKKTSYKKMVKCLSKQDIVLFGEIHDNPITHWLQLEATQDLNEKRDLILGAEMIETDNQDELDLYLSGSIDYTQLDSSARLWGNYKTDYAPLVDFAKKEKIKFVGTNIPRRYASKVYQGGFEALDTLSAKEKAWMAPLPIPFDPNLPKYKEILNMMGDHGTPELVKAQASKDATMAHFILSNYENGHLFVHYNGTYHSDHYEGILWYLKNQQPNLKYKTIATVWQDDVKKLDKKHCGTADYIICVDKQMTRTYAR